MLELKGVDKASSSIIDDESDEVFADLSAAQIKWAQIGKAGDRKSDDLTKIKGVDAETQKKLKVLGIRTYDQLSRICLLYTSPSPRDAHESRMPSSA